MGHESVVYGCIEGMGRHYRDESPDAMVRHNREVLAALPEDDDWPFLVRSMFAVHRRYKTEAIHFGSSFKEIEWAWDEWLCKFEDLLRRLCWYNARVHLRTEATVGHHDYLWEADHDQMMAAYGSPVPVPIRSWRFSGGPRDFPYEQWRGRSGS
jgi:hypothetical protein